MRTSLSRTPSPDDASVDGVLQQEDPPTITARLTRVVAFWWKGDIAAKTLTPMPDYPIEVSLQQWLEAAFFTIVLVKATGRAGAPAVPIVSLLRPSVLFA